MKYETPAQKACYEKVLPWIEQLKNKPDRAALLDRVAFDPETPTIYLASGSASALVEILPWQEDDAIINTRSYVVTEVELVPTLLDYLLRENDRLLFGAFGVDREGDVFLNHSIVGSTCDPREFETSVRAILSLADDYDDAIVARWGGRRAVDREPLDLPS